MSYTVIADIPNNIYLYSDDSSDNREGYNVAYVSGSGAASSDGAASGSTSNYNKEFRN